MAMDKSKIKDHLIKINERFEANDLKKCQEFLKNLLKHTSLSLDILLIKLKIEEATNKFEDALKTANMILFIQPYNQESHQAKIRILQSFKRYEHLSDCLLSAKTLFPNITFN